MRMPRFRFTVRRMTVAVAILTCLAGVAWVAARQIQSARAAAVRLANERRLKMFGDGAALEVVSHPTRVEAFRLVPPADVRKQENAVRTVLSGPVAVPAELAGRLSRALVSPDSYLWGGAPACYPAYGVRLSFYRGEDRVDLLLCMTCHVLLVQRDGRDVSGGCFHPIAPLMVDAVVSLFPDDPLVQALKVPGKPAFGL
jgi:hypothetical protein